MFTKTQKNKGNCSEKPPSRTLKRLNTGFFKVRPGKVCQGPLEVSLGACTFCVSETTAPLMFDGFSPSEEQWCAERLYIKGKLYRGQLYKALANTLLKAPVEFEENNTIGYLQDNSFVIFLESLCFQNYEGYGWFKVIAGDLVGWCFFSKLLELTTDNIDSNSINENNIIRDES